MVSQVAYTNALPKQATVSTKNIQDQPSIYLKKSGEPDTDTFVKNDNKATKIAVATGVGVAGLAAITGLVVAAKKGKLDGVINKVKGLFKPLNSSQKNAKKAITKNEKLLDKAHSIDKSKLTPRDQKTLVNLEKKYYGDIQAANTTLNTPIMAGRDKASKELYEKCVNDQKLEKGLNRLNKLWQEKPIHAGDKEFEGLLNNVTEMLGKYKGEDVSTEYVLGILNNAAIANAKKIAL